MPWGVKQKTSQIESEKEWQPRNARWGVERKKLTNHWTSVWDQNVWIKILNTGKCALRRLCDFKERSWGLW